MPTVGWMRKWRSSRDREDPARAPVLAAARGEPLSQLLHLGARAMLAAAGADRAGLWLSGDRRGESGAGCVVEAQPGPIPEQWKRLDISTPFLRAALENPDPLSVEFIAGEKTPRLGPLIGMHSAVWIPLRDRGRTVGLAMVGYARPPGPLDLEALRARADEITLAVQHQRSIARRELAAEELRAQLQLSRAILCGVAADSILPQIARAARHYVQAEFVAVGRASAPPTAGEGWDGAAGWFSALQQENILQLWRQVFKEGRESEIQGETLGKLFGSSSEVPPLHLDRVVAIPIEVRNATRGVFMAGLSRSDDPIEDSLRLESFALLAASALDREAAGEDRAASGEALQKVIDGSAENLILIDRGGKILQASRAAAMLLFTPPGRADGTRVEEFFSVAARDAVSEWREQLSARASMSRMEAPAPAFEAALERGGILRLCLRGEIPAMGGNGPKWLLHIEDQGTQQTLHETEERLESEMGGLLDSIESGVLLLDAEGRIHRASDRLAAIFGLESRRLLEFGTLEALIASVAQNFLRPAETAARWRDAARQGDEANWDEFELVRPARKIVERFSRPLYKRDGARLGWLEVFRDITAQRLIQSKLLQTEKMAALGQLVSGIAHELNNPLTSIQGYAQLLLSRRSATDRAEDAARISQEAERAGRIVKNLLLFSREAKPEKRPVHLNEVIERTLSLCSYELKLENIEVELALDTDLPQVHADAAQLQQVVLNLIVNAEQAIVMARGEEPRDGHILIRTRRVARERLTMEISDDGPGIPAEISSRIFDPFFTTKPPGAGTGLGLSIIYGIVQEHGGEVTVDSLPGRGATMVVELPALPVSAPNFGSPEPAPERGKTGVISLPVSDWKAGWKDILIVEDEPTVANLIADVLTEEGYRVDMLLDSREALARLEQKRYSLAICDLKMPYLDGPGLYRALVRRENPMQHRVLFVTGDTMGPRTLEFLKNSALPYLAKPFLVEELKEAVRNALAGVPASDEAASGEDRSRAAVQEH
jgi:signal transduction histidine kinase/CheY-like chemotaxis protein